MINYPQNSRIRKYSQLDGPDSGQFDHPRKKKIRYAVVGLGWIAQEAVLPAFKNATENSELTAFVSDDKTKCKELGERYNVAHHYSYKEYDRCLENGLIDAVFIALPNSMHHEYAVRAAQAGIHVLCEKPFAVTSQECQDIISETKRNKVKLMVAYRLHFDQANLKAVEIAQSGRLGDLRIVESLFTMSVEDEKNIRLDRELGGGTLYDTGIYCLNAARSIFRAEPIAVSAFSIHGTQKRFDEVDEMTSAMMVFPGNRLATFTTSFGSASTSRYNIIGTKGVLEVDSAFHHNSAIDHILHIDGQKKRKHFPARDQFGPELVHFSDAILHDTDLEASGREGLADVRVIEALYASAREGRVIILEEFQKAKRPSMIQEIRRPKLKKPELVHAHAPKG
jgi:predicted dehydrogenase